MKALSQISIIIMCFLFNINACTSATEVRAMSCADFEEQFKVATKIVPRDARMYVQLLIENNILSKDDIAEALRIETSTVDHLLSGDTCYALCKRLKSYMSAASVPLSLLKEVHERDDVDDGKDITEEDYFRSKTKILLPRKLKNRTKIFTFLKDITQEDRYVIRALEKSLCLTPTSLDLFLSNNGIRNTELIINALRDYYWSENVVPLRDVAAQASGEKYNLAWWGLSLLCGKIMGNSHFINFDEKDK